MRLPSFWCGEFFSASWREFRAALYRHRLRRTKKKSRPTFAQLQLEELETRLVMDGSPLGQANPAAMGGGLDATLVRIHDSLEEAVNQVGNLPLIGNKIQDSVQPLLSQLEQAGVKVNKLIDNLFSQLAADPNANANTIFQNGLYGIFGPQLLNILQDGPDAGTTIGVSDIVVTQGSDLNAQGNPIAGTEWFQWNMRLGQSGYLDVPLDLSVSLPPELSGIGFQLGTNGGLRIATDWHLDLGFGVDAAKGYFLVTGPNSGPSTPEFVFDASVAAAPGGLTAFASLGALRVRATDGTIDPVTGQFVTSGLNVHASVDLVEPKFNAAAFNPTYQGTANRLYGTEIQQGSSDWKKYFKPVFTADGGLHMHVTSDPSLQGILGGADLGFLGDALQPPQFDFDFNVTGSAKLVTNPVTGQFSFTKRLDNLSFDNIQMDIKGLADEVLQPMANVLGSAMGPFTEIIGSGAGTASDFLHARLPLVSDLAGHNVNLIELSGGVLAPVDALAQGIGGIADFIDGVNDFLASYNGQPIPLGSWVWVDLIKKFVPREAVTALTFNLPPLDLPSVNLPNLQLPTLTLPDIYIPNLNLSIPLPNITLPSIPIGPIQLPDLNIKLPILRLPNFELPDIQLPEIDLPDITLPDIFIPEYNLTIKFPTISLPNLTLPKISLADLQLNLTLADLTRFSIPIPDINVTVPLPSITLPDFNLTIKQPGLPDLAVPLAHLPSLALPNLSFTIVTPDIALPGVPMPDLELKDVNFGATGFQTGGFKIDIFKASEVVNMLLNKPFNIMRYDLPAVTANFGLGFDLSFWPLDFRLSAGAGISIFPTGLVYDSTGLSALANSYRTGGTVDWSKLLEGFYMPVPANGSNLLNVHLGFSGYASVDIEIASCFLDAGFSGDVYLKVIDPNNDGKLRLTEIMKLTDNFSDPAKLLSMFDAGVSISAYLNAGGEVGGLSFDLTDIGLSPNINFNISLASLFPGYTIVAAPPPPPPELASEVTIDGRRVLRLNIGPYAADRRAGDTSDSAGADITVTGSNGSLRISGYGITDQAYNGTYDYILATGGDGNDKIDLSGVSGVAVRAYGGAGNDIIKTGSGDDLIEGGAGNNTIDAGGGGNTVTVTGSDNVTGGSGYDNVDFKKATSGGTFTSSGGNDRVIGSSFADNFNSTGGTVYFEGRGGNDTLSGSGYLDGGAGNDTLTAGPGGSTLLGGFGDDTLTGGSGNDVLHGGSGTNTLHGAGGNDILYGGSGNDSLFGGAGNDTLYAGLGNQTLDGAGGTAAGTGSDRLYGGVGNDTLITAFGDAWVDGGLGTNSLIVKSRYASIVNGVISDSFLQSPSTGNTPYVNVNTVAMQLGDLGNSVIVDGVSRPFSITGGFGNDTVTVAHLKSAAPVSINLGLGDDTVNVRDTQTVLNLNGGSYAAAGDVLNIDRVTDPVSTEGTLNAGTFSITGIANVNYSSFEFVNINLGTGSDKFTVQDTAADAVRTTIQGGTGYEHVYVYNAQTELRVYGDTAIGDNDLKLDTLHLIVPGDPATMPDGKFNTVLFGVDRLRVDNTTNAGANAAWSFLDGVLMVNGKTIIDAGNGTQAAFFDVGMLGQDSLAMQDSVPASQVVSIDRTQTTIQEGQDVLSYANSTALNVGAYGPANLGYVRYGGPISVYGGNVYRAGQYGSGNKFQGNPSFPDDNYYGFLSVYGPDGNGGLVPIQGIDRSLVSDLGANLQVNFSPDGRLVYVRTYDLWIFAVPPSGYNAYWINPREITFTRDDTGRLSYLSTYWPTQTAPGSPPGTPPTYTPLPVHTYAPPPMGAPNPNFVAPDGSYTISGAQNTTNDYARDQGNLILDQNGEPYLTQIGSTSIQRFNAAGTPVWSGTFSLGLHGPSPFGYPNNQADPGTGSYAVLPNGDIVVPKNTYDFVPLIPGDPGSPPFVPPTPDTPAHYVAMSYDVERYTWNGSTYVLAATYTNATGSPGIPDNPGDPNDDATPTTQKPVVGLFGFADTIAVSFGTGYGYQGGGVPGIPEPTAFFPLTAASFSANATPYDANYYAVYQTWIVDQAAKRLTFSNGQTFNEVFVQNGAKVGNTAHYSDGFQATVPVTVPPGPNTVSVAQTGNIVYGIDSKFNVLTKSQLNADGSTTLLNGKNVGGITANSSIALGANGSRIYVTLGDYNVLKVYDSSLNFIRSTQLQGSPGDAQEINGYVYVTMTNPGTFPHVQVLDLSGNYVGGFNDAQLAGVDNMKVMTTAGGKFVYFTRPGSNAVAVFKFGGSWWGDHTFVQTITDGVGGVTGLVNPGEMTSGVTTNGKKVLYVTGKGQNSIVSFTIDETTGQLTYTGNVRQGVKGVRGLAGIDGLSLSSDGKYLVASGRTGNTLVTFSVDPNSGKLIFLQRLRDGSGTTQGITNPQDVFAYGNRFFVAAGGATVGFADFASFNVPPFTLAGTIGTGGASSTTITGSGTSFITQVSAGQFVGNDTVGYAKVIAVNSDTSLTLISPLTIANGSSGTVTLPPPRVATIQYSGVDSLTETSADGADLFTVRDIGMPLTVNGQSGGDAVTILQTSPNQPTTINVGGGGAVVNVLDTGLNSTVQINGTSGNNTFNVWNTQPGGSLTINGGPGNSTFNVAGYSPDYVRLQTPVTIVGGGANDTLNFNAGTETTTPGVPPVGTGSVKVTLQPNGVNYSGIETLNIFASPVVKVAAVAPFAEGQGTTLNASGTIIPPGRTIAEAAWDIDGDGQFGDKLGLNVSLTWSELFDAGINRLGTYRVAVQVTLDTGAFDVGFATLTVTDTPPTLTLTGPATSNGGTEYQLTLDSSSVSVDLVERWVINWGDGTPTTTVYGPTAAARHTYANLNPDRNYTIQVTAYDVVGSYTASKPITVLYMAPTVVSFSGASTLNEGGSYTLNLSAVGPNAASLQEWIILWGDGQTSQVAGATTSLAHTYADDGAFLIRAFALWTDGSLTQAPGSVALTVANVLPTLNATGGPATMNEGQSYTLNLSSSDPGADVLRLWEINWGDGQTSVVPGSTTSLSHVYGDNGSFTILVRASDEEGTYPSPSTWQTGPAVTVNNVAPTITLTGPASINEVAAYELGLSISDPGLDNISSFHIVWGDGTTTDVGGDQSEATHVYQGPLSATIQVTAYDEDSPVTGYTVTKNVNVLNVLPAPTVTGDPRGAFENTPYTITLASYDPGAPVDSWTVNWDDGNIQNIAARTSNDIKLQLAGSTALLAVDGVFKVRFDYGATVQGAIATDETAGVTVSNITTTNPGGGATGETTQATVNFGTVSNLGEGVLVFDYVSATNYKYAGARNLGGRRAWVIGHVDASGAHDDATMLEGVSQQVTHTYVNNKPNDAVYAVTATAHQGASNYVAPVFNVRIFDTDPEGTVTGTPQVNAAQAFSLNIGPVTDPGADTITQYRVNWDDGSTFGGNPYETFASGGVKTHVFADAATRHDVVVGVVDNDGYHAIGSVTVVREGAAYTTTLNELTGALAGLTYRVAWGDGQSTTYDSTAPVTNRVITAVHNYAEMGSYAIQVFTVTAQGQETLVGTRSVVISNVAPTLVAGSPNRSVNEANAFTLNQMVQISDPGFNNPVGTPPTVETFAYTINWGDGSAVEAGAMTIDRAGSPGVTTLASVTGTHTYLLRAIDTLTSTYTVTVTMQDDEGVAGPTHTFDVTVYRPDLQLQSLSVDANNNLVVSYQLTHLAPGSSLNQVVLGMFRSADNAFDASDSLAGQGTITTASDLNEGAHVALLPIGQAIALPGAGTGDVDGDYYLMGKLNASLAQPELDYTNNTADFLGQQYRGNSHIFAHGTDNADNAQVSQGSVIVDMNGVSREYFGAVVGVRLRTHGGNDQVGSTYPEVGLILFGGDGADRLYWQGNGTQSASYQPGAGAVGNQILFGGTVSGFQGVENLVLSNLGGVSVIVPGSVSALELQNTIIPGGGMLPSAQPGQSPVVTAGTPFVPVAWFNVQNTTFDLRNGSGQTLSFPVAPGLPGQQSLTVLTGGGDNVVFPTAVNWSGSLNIAGAGNVTALAPMGTSVPLASFSVSGGTVSLVGVHTVGSQSLQGSTLLLSGSFGTLGAPLQLGGTAFLTGDTAMQTHGGTLSLNGSLSVGQSLLLDAGPGTILFNQPVYGAPGGSLNVHAGVAILNNLIYMGRMPGGIGELTGNVSLVIINSFAALTNANDILSADGIVLSPFPTTFLVPALSEIAAAVAAAPTEEKSERSTGLVVAGPQLGTISRARGIQQSGGDDPQEADEVWLLKELVESDWLRQLAVPAWQMLLDILKRSGPIGESGMISTEGGDRESAWGQATDHFFADSQWSTQLAEAPLAAGEPCTTEVDASNVAMLAALTALPSLETIVAEEAASSPKTRVKRRVLKKWQARAARQEKLATKRRKGR